MKFSHWNDSDENVPLKKDKSFTDFDIQIDLNTINDESELFDYLINIVVGEGIDMQTTKNMDDVANDDLKLFAISLMKGSGMTDKEIAERLNISTKQFKRWRNDSPAIKAAYENGTADMVHKLAGKMATRAFGYDYEETTQTIMGDVKRCSNAVENQRTVKIEKKTRHQAPDVGAQIFLLTNLDPDNWKNHRNINGEINANVDTKTNFADAVVEAYQKRKEQEKGASDGGSEQNG